MTRHSAAPKQNRPSFWHQTKQGPAMNIATSSSSLHPDILESNAIHVILNYMRFDSCLVLDLDNTVFEPSNTIIGSDQWFGSLMTYACNLQLNQQDAVAAVIAIYNEVHKHVEVKPVEQDIVKFINSLQQIGIPIIALTARGPVLEEATNRQLKSIGIDLHGKIIFCDGKDKGDCFKTTLTNADYTPKHIVMVDDKEKHLIHVKKVVTEMGIEFHGIRYSHLDEKIKTVDMQRAHIELATLEHQFTDEAKEHIKNLAITSYKKI